VKVASSSCVAMSGAGDSAEGTAGGAAAEAMGDAVPLFAIEAPMTLAPSATARMTPNASMHTSGLRLLRLRASPGALRCGDMNWSLGDESADRPRPGDVKSPSDASLLRRTETSSSDPGFGHGFFGAPGGFRGDFRIGDLRGDADGGSSERWLQSGMSASMGVACATGC